jgi:hypothetical protein
MQHAIQNLTASLHRLTTPASHIQGDQGIENVIQGLSSDMQSEYCSPVFTINAKQINNHIQTKCQVRT